MKMGGLSLYDVVIPTFIRGLSTFERILNKAEEYAKEKGLDPNDWASAKLIEDQYPLRFQVYNATRVALKLAAFLTGDEPAAYENTSEETMADMHARIEAAQAYLRKVDPSVTLAHEDFEVELPSGENEANKVTLKTMALTYSLPNFYFHLSTGYSILRAKGVPLGKNDLLHSFRTE
ncbi:hypothetical protein BX600DRAFT_468675 [Xylariales sp. PMI_506]|nr:hypothetical protein BX600DRAFT_468675 [Xylariales sp. PMI_506]